MEIGKVGVWFFLDAMSGPESAEFARKVEKLGYKALWIPEAVGREPFAHAAYLLSRTERLTLATGNANYLFAVRRGDHSSFQADAGPPGAVPAVFSAQREHAFAGKPKRVKVRVSDDAASKPCGSFSW